MSFDFGKRTFGKNNHNGKKIFGLKGTKNVVIIQRKKNSLKLNVNF
jgi:hypothetical protein